MGMRDDLKRHGKAVTGLVAKEVGQANTMASEQGLDAVRTVLENEAPHLLEKREAKARREGLPDLNNATKGKVVLRFAPNPNGPLSFGHARGLVINSTYRDMYDGEFILRFDDTDTKVKPPMLRTIKFVRNGWLIGRKPRWWSPTALRPTTNTPQPCWSKGLDTCAVAAQMNSRNISIKTNCPCRTQTPQDNMVFWKRMLNGNFKPGLLSVKTDMTLKNPLRDWPALRLQDTKTHPTLAQRLVPPHGVAIAGFPERR